MFKARNLTDDVESDVVVTAHLSCCISSTAVVNPRIPWAEVVQREDPVLSAQLTSIFEPFTARPAGVRNIFISASSHTESVQTSSRQLLSIMSVIYIIYRCSLVM